MGEQLQLQKSTPLLCQQPPTPWCVVWSLLSPLLLPAPRVELTQELGCQSPKMLSSWLLLLVLPPPHSKWARLHCSSAA